MGKENSSIYWQYAVCFSLVIAILAVYGQVQTFDFVYYDDPVYVIDNDRVKSGISLSNIEWAFKTTTGANWHPVTWLSHMLDVEFFGMNPGAHHLVNVLLHTVNSLLLFLFFNAVTRALWPSAVLAALFALHPLHVESVAWIAERKDVLSSFFWMLVMVCYGRYAKRPTMGRYLPVLLFFLLGLMTKPMLVSLPFVLLLLDYWPLGRFVPGRTESQSRFGVAGLIIEKIPLFLLAGISCAVTFLAQHQGGAVSSLAVYPIDVRIANALNSYVVYILKMIWPLQLAVFYPHPGKYELWPVLGSAVILGGLSLLVFQQASRRPYLVTGWLWYVGTLVPVIGLVQVGEQALADRYTYVPLTGLFIAISWGVADINIVKRYVSRACRVLIVLLCLATITSISWLQAGYWRDSVALFERANDVVQNSYIIHSSLGNALARKGLLNRAMSHYLQALRLNPAKAADIHNNMGAAFLVKNRIKEAKAHFDQALEIDPGHVDALRNIKKISASDER